MAKKRTDFEAQIVALALEAREVAREAMVERIKNRMEVLGLNPFSTAKRAGLGADYVRDILRGKVKNPSAERLGKLAEALESSLVYLIAGGEKDFVDVAPHDGSSQHPAPLPNWEAADGLPGANLLPIRFELMADTFRRATEVARKPLGYEATTVPPAAFDRDFWWELVRDDSVREAAPRGSLVLVVHMEDGERDRVADGEFVIVQKRLLGPDSSFHLVERSMRRVSYRYPELGLWFLDHATGDPANDETDDVWRQAEPTARRRSLEEYADDIEDPEERAAAHEQNRRLYEAIEKARRANPGQRTIGDRLSDPAFVKEMSERLERHGKWRPKLVGRVVRVLTPLGEAGALWMK